MSQTILRDSYLEQVKTLYDGSAWLGENFMTKLGDVTPEEAFVRPIEGLKSIAEYVFHIIAWRRSVIFRLEGAEYIIVMDSERDWAKLENLQQQSWESLMEELKEIQARGRKSLERIDDDFLNCPFGDHGSKYSFLVEGMIHHDVYHLAQIGVVKKLVRMGAEK